MKKLKSIPVSKVARAGKFAAAGVKVGGNYLKHYSKKLLSKDYDENELDKNNAEDIYKCLSELKGSALKVAQMLSMDRNVMPEAYVDQFSMAQYKAPPISAPLIKKIIKKQLGKEPEKLFDSFTHNALKAASIGQVHKAVYKNRELAVKIQYPGVADSISSDLKLVKPLALKILKLKKKEVKVYFSEVEKKMIEETDYLNEMKQGQLIARECQKLDNIHFTEYLEDLCTDRVLCMEWIEGRQIDEFFSEDIPQKIRNKIGQTLWDFYDYQMHELKFIHADPHPGNFLIDSKNRVNVIDFGCMKKVPGSFYLNYFAAADTTLFNDKERFLKNLRDLEILRPDDSTKAVKFYEKSFNSLMQMAMKPFHVKTFDFADKDFFKTLYEMGDLINAQQKKNKYAAGRGSKHFIYTNRTYYGLYNLLHLLKAKINTGPLDPAVLK
jgi:predicted unusual protein kinase regulating ubiquinone biosynthesis (AarF/ABC1/UbiB family)